ncbi:Uncharacterised protein [Vibrio cholerae]|nr:Uncharacterised protein [Vibrio cholerae]CSC58151.1 Uncharacterised protein [Vibrio cholerae]
MRIGNHRAMTGKMFACGRHTDGFHAAQKSTAVLKYSLNIFTKSTVANRFARKAHIKHRRKT